VKFVLNKISFESCKKEGEEISFARLLHSAVLSFFFLPSSERHFTYHYYCTKRKLASNRPPSINS
jgi:hypothetical protein